MSNKGFTLIEVMISLLILGLVLTAVITVSSLSATVSIEAIHRLEANRIANSKLAEFISFKTPQKEGVVEVRDTKFNWRAVETSIPGLKFKRLILEVKWLESSRELTFYLEEAVPL